MKLTATCATPLLGHLLFAATILPLPASARTTRPAAQSRPAAATMPAGLGKNNFAKWEKQIAAYEAMDRTNPPPKGGVLFIGSSTIRRWTTLEKDFPNYRVINRGFGGSHIVDATHFAQRIIFPYEPRMIFLRAGGNDVSSGKPPEQVLADFKAFVAKIHARLPKTRIVFISVSPSPANEGKWEKLKALNALIEKYTRSKPYLKYLETFDMVLDSDGQPIPELYAADKLHLSPEGYRLLGERVRTLLPKQ